MGLSRGTVARIAARVGHPSKARKSSGIDWAAVREFYASGNSIEECKRRFGFSGATWDAAVCRGEIQPRAHPNPGHAVGETRKRVANLLASGLGISEIASTLGIAKPTVCYHARKLGIAARPGPAKRFDWDVIRKAYDAGSSLRECQQMFGFSSSAWADAVARKAVTPRSRKLPIDELLVIGRVGTNRTHLKQRLLDDGLKENRCEICGITEWNGKPLNMELHHRNGDGKDNRLENLQLLCGNCHAQTDNWGGRGTGRKRVASG